MTRQSGLPKPEPDVDAKDKDNITQACNLFIATMCTTNCWPAKGQRNLILAQESLAQANSQARREKRLQTEESTAILQKVC